MPDPGSMLFLLVFTFIPTLIAIVVLAIPISAVVILIRLLFRIWNRLTSGIFTRYRALRDSQGNPVLIIATHLFNRPIRERSVGLDVYQAVRYRYVEGGVLSFLGIWILRFLIGLVFLELFAVLTLMPLEILVRSPVAEGPPRGYGAAIGAMIVVFFVCALVLAAAAVCLSRLRLMGSALVITFEPGQEGVRALRMKLPNEWVGIDEVRQLIIAAKELPVLSESK